MAETFLTVVGNTSPSVLLTLEHNGTAIPSTGVSRVDLIIVKDSTHEVTNGGHQEADIQGGSDLVIEYEPEAADFPAEGRYIGDAKITYTNGKTEILHEQAIFITRAANTVS